jgi:hypothetical protein
VYILPKRAHLDYNDYNLRPHTNPTRKAGEKVEFGTGAKIVSARSESEEEGRRGVLMIGAWLVPGEEGPNGGRGAGGLPLEGEELRKGSCGGGKGVESESGLGGPPPTARDTAGQGGPRGQEERWTGLSG